MPKDLDGCLWSPQRIYKYMIAIKQPKYFRGCQSNQNILEAAKETNNIILIVTIGIKESPLLLFFMAAKVTIEKYFHVNGTFASSRFK